MSGIATAVIGIGTAAYGIYSSEHAKSQAKKLQANRPTISDSPYLKDQLSLAESELSTGMSGEAKSTYESDMDRSLSTSLSAVLKGGGSPNNIGEIFASNSQGRQRLALMKDNLRLAEIDRISRAEDAKEQERLQQFQVNVDAPWKDQSQAVAAAREGADKLTWEGINTAGSGIMKGLEAGRAESGFSGSLSSVNTPLATTKTDVVSPANNTNYINPNAAPKLIMTNKNKSTSLLDSLLADNNV